MLDSQENNQFVLLDRVQKIKNNVFEGHSSSPEEKAIAWRVAESTGDMEVLERIKKDTNLSNDRFDLAEKFFSEAKETEDELKQEGVNLSPVSQETKEYMIDGLLLGISEYIGNDKPEELTEKLSKILNIVSRAAEGVGISGYHIEDESIGATYLSKRDVKELCEEINLLAVFGFAKTMNRGVDSDIPIYHKQKATLEAINSISEKIIL